MVGMEIAGFRALVQQAQTGDSNAKSCLMESLRPEVERMVRRLAGPAHPDQSYHDWVNTSWERCLKGLPKFRGASLAANDDEAWRRLRAWSRKIVRRVLANAERHRVRHEPRRPHKKVPLHAVQRESAAGVDNAIEPPARDPTPSRLAMSREAILLLSEALQRLPPADREIINLHYSEGLTWDEIAARLHLTVHQVKYRGEKTLVRLRRHLKQSHHE
jgi:RNA polymerase sigma factor (sigma-70 family)